MAGTPTLQRVWSLVRQLQGALGGRRIVSGGLTDGGDVNYGVGFSSTRTGVGTYVVAFDLPFPGAYAIQVGSDGGAALNRSFWSSQTVNGFTFNARDISGAAIDAFVNFIAVG